MDTLQSIKEYSGLKKSQILTLAKSAVDGVLENGNILDVAESLSAMEDFIKSVKADKRFIEYVREETVKHGKVFNSASGAKIELAETGTKYDFSQCGDIEFEILESELNAIDERLKQRKEFLKTLPISGLVVTDQNTGDTWTAYPPSKTSTSSFKITLAK